MAKKNADAALIKEGGRSKGRPESNDCVGREALIQAAIELLRTTTPERLLLKDVAAKANAHPALVRYYFGSKEGLILASVMSQIEQIQTSAFGNLADHSTIKEKLSERLRLLLHAEQQNPHFHNLLMDRVYHTLQPGSEDLLRKVGERGVLNTVNLLHSNSNIPARAIDPRFLYILLVGACEMFAAGAPLVEKLFDTNKVDDDLSARYVHFVTDLLLYGLLERPKQD